MTDQTQQPQTQEPREYSVTELDQAVANGQITQQQRDHMFAQQVERRAMRTAETQARQVVETETRTNQLDGELKDYAKLAPDLMAEGSPLRQRVASEYEFLVSKGAPRDLTTELAATRAVMGPIERARAYAQGKRRGPDAYGDSSGSMTPQERREAGAWERIPADQRAYYDRQIQNGLYPNRAAVLAERNWKRGADGAKRGTA